MYQNIGPGAKYNQIFASSLLHGREKADKIDGIAGTCLRLTLKFWNLILISIPNYSSGF
jgi:hypothetical protein